MLQCSGELPCSSCARRKTECVFTAAPLDGSSGASALGDGAQLELLRKENEDLRAQLDEKGSHDVDNLGALPYGEALALFYQVRARALGTGPVSSPRLLFTG